MPVNWAPNFTIFFFIGNKRNSIKKACKGAPKHTWSIQQEKKKKEKRKEKEEHPKKPKRQKKCYITPPTSCL
jgi:hypothetical protein